MQRRQNVCGAHPAFVLATIPAGNHHFLRGSVSSCMHRQVEFFSVTWDEAQLRAGLLLTLLLALLTGLLLADL